MASNTASSTYTAATNTLDPNEVTFTKKPTTDVVVFSIAPAAGTTIDAVSSVPTLAWTQSGTTWVSSSFAMPPQNSSVTYDLTFDIPARDTSEDIPEDPSFKVKNKGGR